MRADRRIPEPLRLLALHRFERAARRRGMRVLAGLDEAGRGPLAGPVVAACVASDRPLLIPGLDDSKRLSDGRRRFLAAEIRRRALAWGIGLAGVEEIDRYNILEATRLAMRRALEATGVRPDCLLLDAMRLPDVSGPQKAIVRGDARCALIAAASILAKVHRDDILEQLDREDPRYGFARHKGYATPEHLAAIERHGPSPHHRRSFAPLREPRLPFTNDAPPV